MHPDVQAALEVAQTGALRGDTPGRHDNQNISVPAESFVIPADIVSSLGQGNTDAGFKVLGKLFPTSTQQPAPAAAMAAGGKVPIVAATGEFIVGPEDVRRVGGGDMKKGHQHLREFVEIVRKKTIAALKKLPKPARG